MVSFVQFPNDLQRLLHMAVRGKLRTENVPQIPSLSIT